MSLTDLKKPADKAKPKSKPDKVSVDDFIEGANAYAKGKTELTERESKKAQVRNFKKATFTLSPDNIQQLTALSHQTGMAKSKIIRNLIEAAYEAPGTVVINKQ